MPRAALLAEATSGNTRVAVQTPSPQPSPARGEGARESVACATEASAASRESERLLTRENAEAARVLLAPLGIKRILLVTSAWHLARAVPAFQQVGFEVIPRTSSATGAGRC